MGPPQVSPPNGLPIMRVNAQPRARDPHSQRDLQVNLAPRKFLLKTFEPSPLVQQAPQGSVPSKALTNDSGSTTPKSLEFINTKFQNGVQIVAKRSPDERPPPQKRRRKKQPSVRENKRLYLSSCKPIQNAQDVHKDIWRQILGFCEPKFLLEAKTIDSVRYEILTHHQALWRNSRLRHLPDSPSCPARLTEQQYVDLLVGRGCQISTCSQRNTSTVSWAFLGRLCNECLRHRVMKADELPVERQHRLSASVPLWDALSMTFYTSSRQGPPRSTNADATDWAWPRGSFLFLKSDYDKLEVEYLELKSRDTADAEILQWWQQKKNETLRHMREVREISEWKARIRFEQEGSNSNDRRKFFQEKAANMDPPMTEEVLDCMAAFHKALRSSNPPSDLAWEILREKIVPHRDTAIRISGIKARRQSSYIRDNGPSAYPALSTRLWEHRRQSRFSKIFVPEQSFVIELGRRQFAKCVENGVSDSNLVLTCLKHVYDAYQNLDERPNGLSYDGSTGPYLLSLDDARMIIDEVMHPEIERGAQRWLSVFSSFKCPGCRTDHQRKRTFDNCIRHIQDKHAHLVGDEEEFWRLYQPRETYYGGDLDWYTTPWMRCLPVLPSYCDARVLPTWRPDSAMDFLSEDSPSTESAFAGRSACWRQDMTSDPTFTEAFTHAVKLMQGVPLKTPCIMKIALRYALDLSERFEEQIPPLDEFIEAVSLIQKANPVLQLKFRCETCLREDSETPRARHVKYEIAIEQLYKHWKTRHSEDGLHWTHRFMCLPSDAELLEEMRRTDEKTRKDKDEVLAFPRLDNVKKRPNPKAAVILGMSFSMDVFDKLYPRDN